MSNEMTVSSSQTPHPSSNVGFLLQEKVAELEKTLLEKHPRMQGLLKEIWVAVKKQPEQVTLLSEEETNAIFQALEQHLGVFIAQAVVEKKGGSKKVTAASLGL